MKGLNPQRIFGLDLLRTAAILIVVLEHSLPLVSRHFQFLDRLTLPDGVDLFFVLSGFLIGGKLIAGIEYNRNFTFMHLSAFLKRRWLRTLPNYFLFLIVNLLLIRFALIKGEINSYLFSYFCFLQNFFKPVDFLFWESWSLAVEEWFYLLFPILLFSLFRIKPFVLGIKKKLLLSIVLFLTLPLLYRLLSLYFSPLHQDWDLYYRKLVLTRLDAMGFGLLAAFLKQYVPRLWNSGKVVWFLGGCLGLFLLTYFSNEVLGQYQFSRTFYFTLSALLVMSLLPQLDTLATEPLPFKPIAFISRISYSIYLLHIPLFQILQTYSSAQTKTEAFFLYSVYWVLVLVLAYLVYRFFEKPMMNLIKTNEE